MAFNIGFATLAPGESLNWGVYGNGTPLVIVAFPETPGGLMWSDESMHRLDGGGYMYRFTATNLEPGRAVSFSMRGGALL